MKKKLIGFLIFAILISGQGEVVPVLAVDSDVSQFNSENETENTGTIVTDNLSFHGLVEDETKAVTKNQKGLVKRIKKFISFLDNNEEFSTTYIMVGDKISISKRKTQNL